MVEEKVFGVFGLGVFGKEICSVLAEMGGKVLAFDSNTRLVERIKDSVSQAFILDSTDEESLSNAPLSSVDVAIVAIGDRVEASILTTTLLKKLNVPHIIARAISDLHARVLKAVGADEVIFIEINQGRLLAKRLMSPRTLDLVAIADDFSIVEMYVPHVFAEKSIQHLDISKKYHIVVIAIKRTTTSIDEEGNPVVNQSVFFPDRSELLHPHDILIVAGRNSDIDNLKHLH
ncbi:MAG: TrkA family potassium uptake protein [Spirochaetales bacterium]|nr:TrkA family potassium uptake protein [Spirochaetales bacterium]